MAYESALAGVDEGLGGEPLPHERARGTVVDGVDQAADVVVHLSLGVDTLRLVVCRSAVDV